MNGRKMLPEKLTKLIQKAMDEKEYGEIVIKYEAGKIVQVKKTESIKLS